MLRRALVVGALCFLGVLAPLADRSSALPSCTFLEVKYGGVDPIMDPLTPAMMMEIQSHPIWNRYETAPGGADLAFEFLFANGTLAPGEVKQGEMGESIQSHFIAATLRELFPKARLYAGEQVGTKHIRLFVADQAEIGESGVDYWKRKHDVDNFLDMPVLKAANGRTVSLDKGELRDKLGLPRDAIVVHDYNAYLGSDMTPETKPLMATLPAEKLVLVATSRIMSDSMPPERRLASFKQQYPEFTVHLMSTFKAGDLSGKGPHLLVNDLKGVVPLVNRACDLVVVGGPQNMFEGLNAGTPTLIKKYDPEEGPSYSVEEFERMSELALASGGAYLYDSVDAFARGLATFKEGELATIKPPYAIAKDGKTAFGRYLDALMRLLDRNLDRRKP